MMAAGDQPDSASFDPIITSLIECDHALVSIGRRIKVLKAIDWPPELEERFLSSWRRGQAELPAPETPRQVLADELYAAILARTA